MILLCVDKSFNFWRDFSPFLIGILGFLTALVTLIYSHYNNKRNFEYLSEKDKLNREDNLKRDNFELKKDKKERQKSYNKILGSFLKVYHSYLKHKMLFDENGVNNIPDEYLIQQIDKIDNLNDEIKTFKKVANEQAEIIPEITIYLYEILDLLGRFEMTLEQIPKGLSLEEEGPTKLLIQRAHSFAVEELLDEYFTDLIDQIAIKAEVTDEFLTEIKEFNSEESAQKNLGIQNEIMKRYLESLSRQTGTKFDINDLQPPANKM